MLFNYLGVNINSQNDPTKELKGKINSAISGCLRDTVWKKKYMSRSKINIGPLQQYTYENEPKF